MARFSARIASPLRASTGTSPPHRLDFAREDQTRILLRQPKQVRPAPAPPGKSASDAAHKPAPASAMDDSRISSPRSLVLSAEQGWESVWVVLPAPFWVPE